MHVKLQFREQLQVKSQKEKKQIPAYGLFEFYWQMYEKIDAGIRCR